MVKFNSLLLVAALSGILLVSCNRKIARQKEVKQYYYKCPMHYGYTSYQPGKCPHCGMVLEQWEMERPAKNSGNNYNNHNNAGGHTGGCH